MVVRRPRRDGRATADGNRCIAQRRTAPATRPDPALQVCQAMAMILLVEDNDDSRDALARRLSRRGYEVEPAIDGEEAVRKAGERAFDLILMDMNLPAIDGWEATRRIRAASRNRETPIIALTAHAMTGDRDKTLAAGCDAHHAKPVQLPELLQQIELLLDASRNRSPAV